MEYNVKILKIENVTHNVKRFVVEKPKGYDFIPGQATSMSINKPKWETEMRPFTFTSLREDPNLEFVIKIYQTSEHPEHKGFTEKLGTLNTGDYLIIREPWGAIKYEGKGTFIAGGAGITPFIAILRNLYFHNELLDNKLIFSNKTSKDIILEKELKKMLKDNLILTLTKEKNKNYEHEVIDKAFLKKHLKNFNQNFYVCGPEGMVKNISKLLHELGARPKKIIFEK